MSFGWLIKGNEAIGLTAKRFDSKDNPNAAVRPQLEVEFDTSIQVLPSTWGYIKSIWR
jgi:hypothetical protein